MLCFHPHCPSGKGLTDWAEVLAHPDVALKPPLRADAAAWMAAHFGDPPTQPGQARPLPPGVPKAVLTRLIQLCPCLFNQVDQTPTPRAVVHFCELTLGTQINSANVHQAFLIQHPAAPGFNPGPLRECARGGTVMELLCSEVLTSAGIPAMTPDTDRWPDWRMPGHILLYSANSIEGIGFGFFKEPQEFWTASRMSLYKRMGFTAIYMPDHTFDQVMQRVDADGNSHHAININGTALYRPLTIFGNDMLRVVGRSSALL